MNKQVLKSAGMIATTIAVLGVLSWVAFTPDGDLRGVSGIRADEGDVLVLHEIEVENLIESLKQSVNADEATRTDIIQEAIETLENFQIRD
ncbi:MAG: hypothetical protein U9M89_02225 [Patescibacteria group bacterium]|nr:hypothetical protein [Patescibacteria group bacterium]